MNKGFPDEIRQQVYTLQNGICAEEGCYNKIDSFHHMLSQTNENQKKYPLFIHSPMNCRGLCETHHMNFAYKFRINERMAQVYEDYLRKISGR